MLLQVVKDFCEIVSERAVGSEVLESLSRKSQFLNCLVKELTTLGASKPNSNGQQKLM